MPYDMTQMHNLDRLSISAVTLLCQWFAARDCFYERVIIKLILSLKHRFSMNKTMC